LLLLLFRSEETAPGALKAISKILAYRSSGVSPSISKLKSASIWTESVKYFYVDDHEAFQRAAYGEVELALVVGGQEWFVLILLCIFRLFF